MISTINSKTKAEKVTEAEYSRKIAKAKKAEYRTKEAKATSKKGRISNKGSKSSDNLTYFVPRRTFCHFLQKFTFVV